MKQLLLLSILLITCCLTADSPPPQEYTMELKSEKTKAKRQLRLQLEVDESDIKNYGLQQSAIYTEISTRLGLAQIEIKTDTSLPKLVLRIKSIQADRAVATFIELGYFEEVTLLRNNTGILALTWSQATLISGAKDDLVKEVMPIVIDMTNAFILEYNKAFAT